MDLGGRGGEVSYVAPQASEEGEGDEDLGLGEWEAGEGEEVLEAEVADLELGR